MEVNDSAISNGSALQLTRIAIMKPHFSISLMRDIVREFLVAPSKTTKAERDRGTGI
jgi:hypothetical protein